MCFLAYYLIFLFSTLTFAKIQQTRNNQWMRFIKSNANAETLWEEATLFDIILPGSHHSGAYPDTKSYETYWQDQFSSTIDGTSLKTTLTGLSPSTYWPALTAWTKTQRANIRFQLDQGIRWFDLRFEYHKSISDSSKDGWYIHNILFGPSVDDVLAGFAGVVGSSVYNEFMVLQFTDFEPTTVDGQTVKSTTNPLWQSFWGKVITTLTSDEILPYSSVDDLATKRVTELQDDFTFMIVTEDRMTVPDQYRHLVWDINELMSGTETGATLSGNMKELNRDMLNAGWQSTNLQRVFWTLTPSISDIERAVQYGDAMINGETLPSLQDLNRRIVFQLQDAIRFNLLGSSQWGNVLAVDFVGYSDVVDVVLKLNYNYLSCRDNSTGPYSDIDSCAYKKANGHCGSNAANDLCERSCLNCTWIEGTLYDPCSTDSDCISLGASSSECKIMDDYYNLLVQPKEPRFCLVHDKMESCDEYEEYYNRLSGYSCTGEQGQTFNSAAEQEAYWRDIFDTNCWTCASDAQCASGICNQDFQVCVESRLVANLTTQEYDTSPRLAYEPFASSDCETFRSDIELFRFMGEPDSDFDFESIDKAFEKVQNGDMMALIDDDYLGSIFCFALFPLLLGILMLLALICTPMCYCCANCLGKKEQFENWCCCFKKDQEFSKGQVLVPMVLLVVYSVLILFFCANAIVMNGEISDNILEKGGVIELMNSTMTYATDFMDDVLVPTNLLVDGLEDAFAQTQSLVDSTEKANGLINDVVTNMTNVDDVWSAETLDVEVNSGGQTLTFYCSGCSVIIAMLPTLNSEVNQYAVSASQDMYAVVGDIQSEMLDEEDAIMSDAREYQTQVQNANDQTVTMRTNVLDTMSLIESVEDNRSVVFAVFFMIPMFLLVIGLCGWCQAADLGRKLFRLNYCLAFILSTVTWILFSFFNITVIIWADTCVRLDVMETNITGSELLDQVYSTDTVKKVMDACINGKYLPDAFNLTSTLAFADLENEIVDQLTVDLVGAFDISSINTFRDFVETLEPESYEITVDLLITQYNSECGESITRQNLENNDPHTPDGATCTTAYAGLQTYYSEEQSNMQSGTFATKVQRFKQDAGDLLFAYERLRDFAINDLQGELTNIKCGLNPVFENANTLLNETAYCNEVGQIYGDMKEKSCVDLFKNFEYTNRSLLVVAIFSMFIGICSVALGRRINRQINLFNKKAWNFGDIDMDL